MPPNCQMMPLPRCAFLPLLLLLLISGCDNVGRAFDRDNDPPAPPPTTVESIVQVVPVGGDVRTGRPKVRATYPTGGGWPLAVPIVVEFNESVNEESILPTSPAGADGRIIVRVKGTTQVLPCQYNFLANGRVLVLRPVTALSNAQTPTYEIVMLPEGRDCDGIRFEVPTAGTVLGEFQVNQAETFTDGRILALWPRDIAKDMARDSDFLVVFDRPANVATLVAANLKVQPVDGAPLAGNIELPLTTVGVADGRVARFDPTAALSAATEYELVFTADITFGTAGNLDFRGRTPFARFTTVGPAAPTRVQLGNAIVGFEGKVNRTNFAGVVLNVTTPADAVAGDKVRARIYGGDKETTGIGDLAFFERTADVPAGGAQTIAVDFSGALGTFESPKFDDGTLVFAAQLQRNSETSSFIHENGSDDPLFDLTLPTLTRAGPPGSADGRDVFVDVEHLAFYGTASEALAAATLADGVNPTATMFASDDTGKFLVNPILLGRLPTPRGYTLTLTDRAGNMAAATSTGNLIQRGLITGTFAGTLTVEAYDQTNLEPIVGATVLVDIGVPVVPASGQLVGTTNSLGRVEFSGLVSMAHTVTIVRAGFDLITLHSTQAAFVSLPLRPLTNATATMNGTVAFTPGAGVTAIVGNTAFDSRSIVGVRTANAAPNTIPDTAVVPNRPQLLTGFAGVFEPTANPPFSSQGAQMLGTTLTVPTPPAAPAAGGAVSRQTLALLPSTGQLSQLAAYSEDFGTALGLDLGNLVGGAPQVRMMMSLSGFEGQALVGLGFPGAPTGTSYSLNASYGLPLLVGFAGFSPLLWSAVEARDTAGRISRARVLVVAAFGNTTIQSAGPLPIPVIAAPGPASLAPAVIFDDGFDPAVAGGAQSTFEVTATDSAGRHWVMFVTDRDGASGTDTAQFPDLVTANVAGLASGTWSVQVEGRVWSSLSSATADDFLLAERVRGEVDYSRSAPVTFTIQ